MDLRDALVDWDEPQDEGSNTAHIAEVQSPADPLVLRPVTAYDVPEPKE
jgi:hypothetical protein